MVSRLRFFNLAISIAFGIIGGAIARSPQRIVHGKDISIGEFPSTVVLQRLSGKHLCGGTLISFKHVLTAAHCFTRGSKPVGNFDVAPASGIKIIPGHDQLTDSNNLKYYLASHIDIHPQWQGEIDDRNSEADLAVVTLQTEISENEFQKISPLPSTIFEPDTLATAVGWGLTDEKESGLPSKNLQGISLKVLDTNFCKAHRDPFLPNNVICAEGSNRKASICTGDSGGPLYNTKKEVIGVISYSYECTGDFASVFTDVFAYKQWIEHIKNH
ncbi:chymotrypsin B-like [Fopius arisanus]|uniref:Chymotrypsin B-like n=1 Tax=Fopius arisanus TaxID=64838 RepID=A0A9R1UBU0_9HYME|nr:PREDICTED: chymotrypsin B-like [Fopius arisanus]